MSVAVGFRGGGAASAKKGSVSIGASAVAWAEIWGVAMGRQVVAGELGVAEAWLYVKVAEAVETRRLQERKQVVAAGAEVDKACNVSAISHLIRTCI
ncbi:hypothetical protein GW17_00019403 [Ensete ventricosum]|nr:hypothetical protein GW17_00019403 [Ensete ventricosum]